MTETSVPDAAVQIAMDVIGRPLDLSERHVVAALARAGWLHDPAEVERRLWAVAEISERVCRQLEGGRWDEIGVDIDLVDELRAALDAVSGPSSPS